MSSRCLLQTIQAMHAVLVALLACGIPVNLASPLPMQPSEPASTAPMSNDWWMHALEMSLGTSAHSEAGQHTMQNDVGTHQLATSPGWNSILETTATLPLHEERHNHILLPHLSGSDQPRIHSEIHDMLPHLDWRDRLDIHNTHGWPLNEAVHDLSQLPYGQNSLTQARLSPSGEPIPTANEITHPYFEFVPDSLSDPSSSCKETLHKLLNGRPESSSMAAAGSEALLANRHGQMAAIDTLTPTSQNPTQPMPMFRHSIPASKFLTHHDQFVEVPAVDRADTMPAAAAELSPSSEGLKDVINAVFFGNKMTWNKQGNALFNVARKDGAASRFAARMNVRRNAFQSKNMVQSSNPPFRGKVVVMSHRYTTTGNTVFDADTASDDLRFTFWAPSQGLQIPRLQYVGSASITAADATNVLNELRSLRDSGIALGSPRPSAMNFPVATPRRNTQTVTRSLVIGNHATSRGWLADLPLLRQIEISNAERRMGSISLVPRLHENVDLVKEAANHWLFGQAVVWQSEPTESMFGTGTSRQIEVFRHHRRSSWIFLTRPELHQVLPYEMVLLPYEIRDRRARLFNPSLKGHSHAFTLWAARSGPGGEDFNRFDFVSGGAVSLTKTQEVIDRARSLLTELSVVVLH